MSNHDPEVKLNKVSRKLLFCAVLPNPVGL